MTTFGGQTIPPLFSGSRDGIFISGVGLPLANIDNNGAPAQNIPNAPTNVGDLLVVLDSERSGTTAPIPPTSANWTNIVSISGGSIDLWARIATGDSNDDYRVHSVPQAGSGLDVNFFRQMISLRSSIAGMNVAFQNFGPQNTTNNTLFPILTMPVGADLFNNLVLGIYLHAFNQTTALTATSLQALSGLETIGNHNISVAQPGFPNIQMRFYVGWSHLFQSVAASVLGSNIGYTPVRNGTNRTSFVRFHLV